MALSDQVLAAIEKFCGTKFSSTAFVDNLDGPGGDLYVNTGPIISITSITDNTDASVLVSTTYDFDDNSGTIFIKNGSFGLGRKRYTVSYNAGHLSIPDDVQLAIDQWVAYLTTSASGATKSKQLGDFKEEFFTIGSMPEQVKGLIDKYRRRIYRF